MQKQIKATTKGGHPRFHEIVQRMSDLHDKKNTDYAAGTAEGPLGNFERCSKIMRLYPGMDWASPFGVCIAFMLKQFDAGLTLKAQGRASVTGEPVSSRLTDIAVYIVLGMILDEAENDTKKLPTITPITPKRKTLQKVPEFIATPKARKSKSRRVRKRAVLR